MHEGILTKKHEGCVGDRVNKNPAKFVTKTGTKPSSTTEGHKSTNVLFLFPWPFGVTKSHEHLEYKRIKQLNNRFENKKKRKPTKKPG